jgi:hypothetical protein
LHCRIEDTRPKPGFTGVGCCAGSVWVKAVVTDFYLIHEHIDWDCGDSR